MQDESEAAVEFLEPLRVRQRLLAMCFGQRTGGLASGCSEEVEVFPVEHAAIFGRCEQDQAEQTFAVDQWHADPGSALLEQPLRGQSDAILWPRPAVTNGIELDDPPIGFD